jgi:hypothetical protein
MIFLFFFFFFKYNLKNNYLFFDRCTSWNTNGWNSEKKWWCSIFKLICVCLQEIGNSKFFFFMENSSSPVLSGYNSFFFSVRANNKLPGMRGLYLLVFIHCAHIIKNRLFIIILYKLILLHFGIKSAQLVTFTSLKIDGWCSFKIFLWI